MDKQNGHRVVTKWFQPYVILECVKKYFDVLDFTFTGKTKFETMDDFLKQIDSAQEITVGLYMKNVNKFYLLKLKPGVNQESDLSALENLLFKTGFDFGENTNFDEWVEIVPDSEKAFSMIDLGKAEAAFIVKQG